jgi:hypothetical protein
MTPRSLRRCRGPRALMVACVCALAAPFHVTAALRITGTTLAAHPQAVSLSFERLWVENARGVEQYAFPRGAIVQVVVRWSVSGLTAGTTPTAHIRRIVQQRNSTGWSAPTVTTDSVVTHQNGTYTNTIKYSPLPALGTVRIMVSISLGSVTRTKQVTIQVGRALAAPTATPAPLSPPAHLSLSFDQLLIRNDHNQTTTTLHVNRTMTVVAHYTVQHVQGGHVVGSVHRWYYVWVKGKLTGTDTSKDSIVGVNGPNPANTHTFTPRIIGAWRIVVRITLGAITRQRQLDLQVVP